MKVLKGMDTWYIEAYFAEMRKNGFEVEPTYDSQGVCRGYSIGEKLYDLDGRSNLFACQSKNYSSTVMYKASAKKFGHGRDLTVSQSCMEPGRNCIQRRQKYELKVTDGNSRINRIQQCLQGLRFHH